MRNIWLLCIMLLCIGCERHNVKSYVQDNFNRYTIKEIGIADTLYLSDKYRYDSLKLEKRKFDLMLNVHSCEILLKSSKIRQRDNAEYWEDKLSVNKILWNFEIQRVDSQLFALKDSPIKQDKKLAYVYKIMLKSKTDSQLVFVVCYQDGVISRVYRTAYTPLGWINYYTGKNALEVAVK